MRLTVLCFALLMSAGCSGMMPCRQPVRRDWTRSPYVVPFAKIARGGTNMVLSPLDIPATVIRQERAAKGVAGAAEALVTGTAEGVVNGGARLAAGAAEVLTFPMVNSPAPLYQRRLGESAFRSRPNYRSGIRHKSE